jgi:ribonucleoside-diphosphate reductase alpha chain
MSNIEVLKAAGEAPAWMNEEGYLTLAAGYLLPEETPRGMYTRVARAAASYYPAEAARWEKRFFEVMWDNFLCPASPILSNMGTDRGFPISCNSIHVGDSVKSIFEKATELAVLSKNGAGVGVYMGDVRARGTPIKGNGKSEGIVPWAKLYDVTITSVSQGQTRRGADALYLPIRHGDVDEFLDIRRPTGDINRRCLNSNHAVSIDDLWMTEMLGGDADKRKIWEKILTARVETGEPYLMFSDAANRGAPECYKALGLDIKTSNICTEIFQYTDPDHTFVCCLASLNLVRFFQWPSDLVAVTVRFLDAVMEDYIRKATGVDYMEAALRSAIKGRALGIGALGWHTLLQNQGLPFDGFASMQLNARIFRTIYDNAVKESEVLAKELGEPEWCKGFGRRNTHLVAVAPTVSNSTISGGHSAGIEPIAANIYSVKGAKGTFIRKNPVLEAILEALGKNTPEVWKSITQNNGSVQHLGFLTAPEKEIFLTAREINQHAIVKQAAQRQRWIDQGQSVNLFFASNSDPLYIHQVHVAAWELGLKSLYYCRTEGVIRGDLASRSKDECVACEG